MAENEIKITDIPVSTYASFTDNDLFLIVDDGNARLLRRSTFQAWMLENVQGEKGDTGAQGLTGASGTNGINGTNGVNGLSAYQVAVNNGYTGTESQWVVSLKGATGSTGATGNNGWTPTISTEVRNTDELVLKISDWTGGSGTKPAIGYVSSTGIVANISNATNIRGSKGDTGAKGDKGDTGAKGSDGKDAVKASSIEIQQDQSILLTYSDNTTLSSNVPPRVLGWGSYKDGQYTEASPFNIAQNTTQIVPNNSATVLSNGMPTNIASFYNNVTQKCTMNDVNGMYAVRVKFKISASSVEDHVQIIFSKNTSENPYVEDAVLRGDNIVQEVNFNTIIYGDAALSGNGMTISLKTFTRAISIYSIEFIISKIN